MEITTFTPALLSSAQEALRDAFSHPGSDPLFNEWTFAAQILTDAGYLPELCLAAVEQGEVVGYNILTLARIGEETGLALGPLGVRSSCQGKGIGTLLVQESIRRAKKAGYPWIALLGGDYYARFGFEKGRPYGITVTDNDFDNDHLQLLFLEEAARARIRGKLTYCSAFYHADGHLL
jgi:predicted N-acetyltransferase YhbS